MTWGFKGWITGPVDRSLGLVLTLALLSFGWAGCKSGGITEYQAPAAILRAFRAEHPSAASPSFSVTTKDGIKVYQVEFMEDEAEREVFYNVQGKPFVSKADKRKAEQERERLEEEAREAAEEKQKESAPEATQGESSEHAPEHPHKTGAHSGGAASVKGPEPQQ